MALDDWLDRLLAMAERQMAEPHDLQPYGSAVLGLIRDSAETLRDWGPDALAAVLDAYVHRSPLAAWHLVMEQVQEGGKPGMVEDWNSGMVEERISAQDSNIPSFQSSSLDRTASQRAAFLEGLLRLVSTLALRALHGLVTRATET